MQYAPIKKFSLFTLIIHSCFTAHAQPPFFNRSTDVPVLISGQPLANAWGGGMDHCQFSAIDMDGDGLKDLFVFDRTSNKIFPFIRKPGTDTVNFRYVPEYRDDFPPLHDWAILTDYNGDGLEDIFWYSNGGFGVYKNESDASGLRFTLIKDLVYTKSGSNTFNLWVSPADIPAIADVDNDGDLDVLTFGIGGTCVEYHRNRSMELYGHRDSLVYERVTCQWGNFSENVNNNSVRLSTSCSCKGGPPSGGDLPLHSGSTVLALDMDGDRDRDLILGDVSFPNLVMLINGGDSLSANMVSQDTLFPEYDVPADLSVFPAAFYVDVNNDGRRDLLSGTNSANSSENLQSIWYYKNIGTDAVPLFELQTRDLFQRDMLDFGSGAYPAFLDHNGDGLQDIILGNYYYYKKLGGGVSQLALLENTGTATSPEYTLVTRNYHNFSTLNLYAMSPAFGDMDGDGDMDMILGHDGGSLHYFVNTAGAGNTASFVLMQPNFEGLDAGNYSSPFIADLNRDGRPDLVVGEEQGNLNFFPNIGTSSVPKFSLDVNAITWQSSDGRTRYAFSGGPELYHYSPGERIKISGATNFVNNGTFDILVVDDANDFIVVQNNLRVDASYDETSGSPATAYAFDEDFGGVKVYGAYGGPGYSRPFLAEDSGKFYLLVGSETGDIHHYTGMDGRLDSAFVYEDPQFQNIWEGGHAAVAGADVNADGMMDLVVGNFAGGVSLYKGSLVQSSPEIAVQAGPKPAIHLYPNPAGSAVTVELTGAGVTEPLTVEVYTVVGQMVGSHKGQGAGSKLSVDVSGLSGGLYIVRMKAGPLEAAGRFVKGER